MEFEVFRWLNVGASVAGVVVSGRHLAKGGRFFRRTRRAQESSVAENRVWGWVFTLGFLGMGVGMVLENWALAGVGFCMLVAPGLRYGGQIVEPPSGAERDSHTRSPSDEHQK